MKRKCKLSMVLLLVLHLLLPGSLLSTVSAAEEDSFEPQVVAQYDFEDGTTEGWVGRGIGLEVIEDEAIAQSGNYSVLSKGRTQGWHGPALNVKGIFEKSATYEITGYVKRANPTDAPSTIIMAMVDKTVGADTSFNWIANQSVADGEWAEFKGDYSITEDKEELTLYFESQNATEEFYIDHITITMTAPPSESDDGGSGDVEIPEGEEVAALTDFEDGTTQGWVARNGHEEVTVTSDTAKNGDNSLLISNRQSSFDSAKLDTLAEMYPGNTYLLSAWVKLAPGSEATELQVSRAETIEGVTSYYPPVVNPVLVTADEWVLLEGTYTLTSKVEDLYFYVEEPYDPDQTSGVSFYMDDFKLEVAPEFVPEDIPALKDVFADYFDIGAAVEPQHTSGSFAKMLEKHYNMIVAENSMKPEPITPSEGTYNWSNADALFDYAEENGMKMRYHTLVWHSQTPNWLFLDENGNEMVDETDPVKREANKELLLERMKTYITEIVTRYKGKVDSWDVVNEVISDNPNDTDGLRDSKWQQITGTAFIEEAFKLVKALDPDSKLYINDYGTHNPSKRDFLYNLVKDLQEKGVPIDGVGHQTHITITDPSIELISESIEKFGSIGLDNQITELDVSIYTSDSERYNSYEEIPDSIYEIQARRYKELFDELKRLSDHISSVVFWGIGDEHTWLHNFPVQGRTNAPFVFDENLKAKLAYWALVDPSKLPVQINTLNVAKGTPTIDGKTELTWDIMTPVKIDTPEGMDASFKTTWDEQNLYVLVDVKGPSLKKDDSIELFIDRNNGKTDSYQDDDTHYTFTSKGGNVKSQKNYAYKRTNDSYQLEVAIPLNQVGKLGDTIGFDIRLKDSEISDEGFSWNDTNNSQDSTTATFGALTFAEEIKVSKAVYDTPQIDGVKEAKWDATNEIETTRWVEGTTGSTAKVRTLWDEEYLYIFAEVKDSKLSKASGNVWEQDSVEIFVDQNNAKTDHYQNDDGQYRVNFDNEQSYGGVASADTFVTATQEVEGGYIIEAAIKLTDIEPQNGTVLGFDFQVNNDEDGNGSRDSVAIWKDPTGQSFQNTSKFGVLVLTK